MENNKNGWQKFIDETLVEWGRNPAVLDDEEFQPPSARVIDLACEVATSLRDGGEVPPTRVVADGEGGVSFERVDGQTSVSLNIHPDATIEMLTFDDCRLRSRRRIF